MITKKQRRSLIINELEDKIHESIQDYIANNALNNTVSIGSKFCEWILLYLFDLREDQVIEATEIGGQQDNGIDAIFEVDDELFVIQSKYNNSHSIDSVFRFKEDCTRLLTENPVTERQVVKEQCKKIREFYEKKKKINCYYITNKLFTEHENQVGIGNKKIAKNVEVSYLDIQKITEKMEEELLALPRNFRYKTFSFNLGSKFIEDDRTIIALVTLRDFAKFVEEGGKLLFHSNIRNYLNKTNINKGIFKTLEEYPEKFEYYNNGVTIVCDWFTKMKSMLRMESPQIVNGCQTANSILRYFNQLTDDKKMKTNGKLLVKIIRTIDKNNEEVTKELRDNITRFTNSQNAVKGLDFYSLDTFQRKLQIEMKKLKYYYEIQRGAFINLEKNLKIQYVGEENYKYLVPDKFKFVVTAKETLQAFAAGIKQMPSIAYGQPSALTPIGEKWGDIANDQTSKLPVEFFLFPVLVHIYSKNNLGYKYGASNFKKSSSLLYIATYYQFLIYAIGRILNKYYEEPVDIDNEIYKKIFQSKELNMKLLEITDEIMSFYFKDSAIKNEVSDDLQKFLKRKVKSAHFQSIMKEKIKDAFDDHKETFNSLEKSLI